MPPGRRRPLVQVRQGLEPDGGLHVGVPLQVLLRERRERADALPEVHVGLAREPGGGPQQREHRPREHARPDHHPLGSPEEELFADARRIGPRLGRRERRHSRPHVRIARDGHASAVRVERFQRLEAEDRPVAEGARRLPPEARAQGVRAVLDHRQPVPASDGRDCRHVAHQAVQVGRDDRAGFRADGAIERGRIERRRPRVDVGEDRDEAGDARQLGHDPERERRKHDLAPSRQRERLQEVVERHPSERRRRGPRHPEPPRERPLELGDVRSLHQQSPRLHGRDGLLRVRDDASAVAGDRPQHDTLRAISANSRRACMLRTLASSLDTTSCAPAPRIRQ